jgi:hypothetical protein
MKLKIVNQESTDCYRLAESKTENVLPALGAAKQ